MVNSIYRIFKWAVKESGTWEIYLVDNFICISFLSIILFLLILNIGLSYSRLTFNKFNLENINLVGVDYLGREDCNGKIKPNPKIWKIGLEKFTWFIVMYSGLDHKNIMIQQNGAGLGS